MNSHRSTFVALLCILIGPRLYAADPAATPALPLIPDHVFNLTDYGGTGDGKTLNTPAFKKAFAAIAQAGGGTLIVPAGDYLTLPFSLVSHLNLQLQAEAKIQFPRDLSAYDAMDVLPPRPQSLANMDGGNGALVLGDQLTDVAITGPGTIDGGGWAWWGKNKGLTTQSTEGQSITVGRPGGRATVGKFIGRPKMIILTGCQRVHLDGPTLLDSPMWFFVPVQCTDVTIENVHVKAPARSPNTDALDPTASTHVLIRNCDLDEGDDNVAIKAIGGPCSFIRVENVRCGHGHGISIGSETYGGVHDVTVSHCTFNNGDNGIRIKSARDRGNQLFNFRFSDITMDNVTNPIVIDMYYSGGKARETRPVTPTTPILKNVEIRDVKIRGGKSAGRILGLPEAPVSDIRLTNIDITAQTGLIIQDVKNCVLENVNIRVSEGKPIVQSNAEVVIKP